MLVSRFSCSGCMSILAMALIGSLVAGPRGLLAGFVFGVVWTMLFQSPARRQRSRADRFRRMVQELLQQSTQQKRPAEAINALTGLFMAVVRQNDRGMREIHVQMAQQVLRVYAAQGGISTRRMIRSFRDWENAEIPVKELAGRVTEYYPAEARRNFIHDMMMVAFADGQMQKDEEGILRYLTEQFGMTEADYDQVFQEVKERLRYSEGRGRERRRRSSGSRRRQTDVGLTDAYDTLGLDPDASEDEVKSRYRELAREHHPDNISADSEAEKERAQEKMVEINRAYKRIKESMN